VGGLDVWDDSRAGVLAFFGVVCWPAGVLTMYDVNSRNAQFGVVVLLLAIVLFHWLTSVHTTLDIVFTIVMGILGVVVFVRAWRTRKT
jgi:hypothetical protein